MTQLTNSPDGQTCEAKFVRSKISCPPPVSCSK